jgi:hypothetical protein
MAARPTIARTRTVLAVACAALGTLALGACGNTVSTGAFKGEEREVAQAIANLQSDVTAGDEQKICSKDLAGAVLARLNAAPGGCKRVIKDQLAEIDSSTVRVDSVALSGAGAQPTATAKVRSIVSGKTRISTVSLVKEAGKWKISAVSLATGGR